MLETLPAGTPIDCWEKVLGAWIVVGANWLGLADPRVPCAATIELAARHKPDPNKAILSALLGAANFLVSILISLSESTHCS